MITIAILEDEEVFYLAWEQKIRGASLPLQTQWIQCFWECYSYLNSIDILVTDRTIITGGIEHDLLLDGHIEKIRETFKGPIVLSSEASLPFRFRHHFAKIVRSKMPPDIEKMVNDLLPNFRKEA